MKSVVVEILLLLAIAPTVISGSAEARDITDLRQPEKIIVNCAVGIDLDRFE